MPLRTWHLNCVWLDTWITFAGMSAKAVDYKISFRGCCHRRMLNRWVPSNKQSCISLLCRQLTWVSPEAYQVCETKCPSPPHPAQLSANRGWHGFTKLSAITPHSPRRLNFSLVQTNFRGLCTDKGDILGSVHTGHEGRLAHKLCPQIVFVCLPAVWKLQWRQVLLLTFVFKNK